MNALGKDANDWKRFVNDREQCKPRGGVNPSIQLEQEKKHPSTEQTRHQSVPRHHRL